MLLVSTVWRAPRLLRLVEPRFLAPFLEFFVGVFKHSDEQSWVGSSVQATADQCRVSLELTDCPVAPWPSDEGDSAPLLCAATRRLCRISEEYRQSEGASSGSGRSDIGILRLALCATPRRRAQWCRLPEAGHGVLAAVLSRPQKRSARRSISWLSASRPSLVWGHRKVCTQDYGKEAYSLDSTRDCLLWEQLVGGRRVRIS